MVETTRKRSGEAKLAGPRKKAAKEPPVPVKVIVRVRPLKEDTSESSVVQTDFRIETKEVVSKNTKPETNDGESVKTTVKKTAIAGKSVTTMNHKNKNESLMFSFDAVYGPGCINRDIFNECSPTILKRLFHGQNASIFAYGPTGSGKTHTMAGTKKDPGVIKLALRGIFRHLKKYSKGGENETSNGGDSAATVEELEARLNVSYLEIYQEKIYDLLNLKNKDLPIRQTPEGKIFIAGLSESEIKNYDDFENIYSRGLNNRRTAETRLNSTSSRSHAVLLLRISVKRTDPATKVETLQHGKLYLIDLAGSEDNRRTNNTGTRMTESAAINTSLFTLNKVVDALNSKASRIPYRESKLTRLLQDSLGGSAQACMICNISPESSYLLDTASALAFASKSRTISSTPFTVETTRRVPDPGQERVRQRRERLLGLTSTTKPQQVTSTTGAAQATKDPRNVPGPENSEQSATGPSKRDTTVAKTVEPIQPAPTRAILTDDEQRSQKARRIFRRLENLEDARPLSEQKDVVSKSTGDSTVKTDCTDIATPATRVVVSRMHLKKANKCKEHGDEEGYQLNMQRAIAFCDDAEVKNKLASHLRQKDLQLASVMNVFDFITRKASSTQDKASLAQDKGWDGESRPTAHGEIRVIDDDEEFFEAANARMNDLEDQTWEPPAMAVTIEETDTSQKTKGKMTKTSKSKKDENVLSSLDTISIDPAIKSKIVQQLLDTLNNGDLGALLSMKSIGVGRAQKILAYRDKSLTFHSLEDLKDCGFRPNFIKQFVRDNMGQLLDV
eukprot:Clim_evm8s67 gene=Clim_evmTU8s67